MADQQTLAPEDQAPVDGQTEGSFDDYFAEFSSGKAAQNDAEAKEQEQEQAEDDQPDSSDSANGEDDSQPEELELTPRERELQEQLERLRQSESSQRGRVGAYQRQINELKRQLDQDSRPTQQGGPGGQQPREPSRTEEAQQEADQKQAMADAVGSEDWESLKQDFPDIARALEARLDADRQERTQLQQEVAELRSTVQPIQQQAHEQYLDSQMRALEARHSDWQEVVNAPAFQQWLQQQPPSIQTLMESDDAAEAAALLDFYKNVSPATGSDSAQADAQREKRQQRLAGAMTPQRRGAARRDAVPDDWEGQFNHFAKQKR